MHSLSPEYRYRYVNVIRIVILIAHTFTYLQLRKTLTHIIKTNLRLQIKNIVKLLA